MTPNVYFPVTASLVFFTLGLAVFDWETHDNLSLKKLRLCFRFWIEENSDNSFLLTVNGLIEEWNAGTHEVSEIKNSSHVVRVYLRLCFQFFFIIIIILAKGPLSGIPNLLVFTKEFSIISLAVQVNKHNHDEYSSWFTFAKQHIQIL